MLRAAAPWSPRHERGQSGQTQLPGEPARADRLAGALGAGVPAPLGRAGQRRLRARAGLGLRQAQAAAGAALARLAPADRAPCPGAAEYAEDAEELRRAARRGPRSS